MKIPLISISGDLEYKKVCEILNQIQNDTRTVKNKVIQLCWEFDGFKSDYKEKYNLYPKVENIMPLKTLNGNINSVLKTQFSNLYSSNLSTTINDVCRKFSNEKKEYKQGQKSIASFRSGQPIDLHNKSINIDYNSEKNEWYVNLSLISRPYAKELGLKRCGFPFRLIVKDNSQKTILERCFDDVYKITASQIVYNKKKKQWFLYLGYEFTVKTNCNLDENNIMGIDMGIVYPVYISFNHCKDRYFINGGEIERYRKQVERRIKQLQNQSKYCGEGRVGHGVQTRIKPIYISKNKTANFRDTTNHKYSQYIIKLALKHGCGTIQIENLNGISKDNVFLRNWSYYDLQQKIEYKAKIYGIKVVYVNPKYTSQRCSVCGRIDSENRKEQSIFKCTSCGFETNADYNASQNIATKDIEKIIINSEKHNSMRIVS